MPEFSRNFQILSPGGFSFKKDDIKVLMKCGMGRFCFLKNSVGFTMMCDTGAGAVEMWKTAVRFPHIPTALLRCLRRFSGLREKKVANRDGLC